MRFSYFKYCILDFSIGVNIESFSVNVREICPELPILSITFMLGFVGIVVDFGGEY